MILRLSISYSNLPIIQNTALVPVRRYIQDKIEDIADMMIAGTKRKNNLVLSAK